MPAGEYNDHQMAHNLNGGLGEGIDEQRRLRQEQLEDELETLQQLVAGLDKRLENLNIEERERRQ